ncbi:aspartyl-tRNA(Asn) amidotransferase subunit C [Algibacter lectus]|uniref:Aspartyl-tRNA(Asn) amidotransferase subunit C n=1 Tax=Algibacter lectus TaxID=221126 RepID=A0A090VKD9_9FLAO|nr:aspartyl-tRNA(Asn) amidotransferase subunit C [Algibacter lectus]
MIKNAQPTNNNTFNNNHNNSVSINDLRDDVVIESSVIEKQIIIENFPKEKNGYLVVSKVIEE